MERVPERPKGPDCKSGGQPSGVRLPPLSHRGYACSVFCAFKWLAAAAPIMLNKDNDTIVTQHRDAYSFPQYQRYNSYGFKSYGPFQAEMPKQSLYREILPEWSPYRENMVLPSTTGLESLSFEDKVRFLYSVNNFLGASFRPMALDTPIKTYAHSALDNPIISGKFRSEYEHDALLRAQQIFLDSDKFSPETFAELRRVADKTFFLQKFTEWDFFMDPIGWRHALQSTAWLENVDGISQNAWGLKFVADKGLGLEYMIRANRSTRLVDRVAFWTIDFITTLADFVFISFYNNQYRDWIVSRFSLLYQPRHELGINQSATAGGCGMSSGLDPMREDPGNYVLDLDVHMTVLSKVSDYATVLNLAYFAGTIPALSEWWYYGSIVVDRTALSASIAVLFVLLFGLVAATILPFSIVRTPVQYAAVFELIGLCVASLFALFGLMWYDPIGQIIAVLSIIISSCEFIVLLSQSLGAVRRVGRPILSVAVLWGLDFGAIKSAVGSLTLASLWSSTVSTIAGASSYVMYVPVVVAFGVPAVGSVLLLSAMWDNYLYAITVRAAFPVHGERYAYEDYPLSNLGSDKVHDHVAAIAQTRHAFEYVLGDVDSIAQSVALVTKYGTISVAGTDTATPYGTFIPVVFGAFVFMLVVFALLLTIFSSKTKWSDFRDATTQYECGSEQTALRVTPLTALSFFRLLLIF